MYSRYQNRPERPVQLPENYSGIAFSRKSEPDVAKRSTESIRQTTAPPKSPYPARLPSPVPPPLPEPIQEELPEEAPQQPPPPVPSPVPSALPHAVEGLLGNFKNSFPFGHGMGSEELLLIGLILLLSQNGEDRDMILWLALLLFSG